MNPTSSRRSFLRHAAPFAALAARGAPARANPAGPAARPIRMGVIGCGGKARGGALEFHKTGLSPLVAVADVNLPLARAFGQSFQVPAQRCYQDFRELLALPEVEAVLIATPDHWHVPCALSAARAGKHIYCEKPLGVSIAEGQALVRAVAETGVVFQHGTQLRSLTATRLACEAVRNGRLGDVRKVVIGSPPGRALGAVPAQPVPEGLDWAAYCGAGPAVEFRREIIGDFPGGEGLRGWYFMKRFSPSGWVAGYAVHDVDLAHWGLGLEHTGPVLVEGRGAFPREGLFDTVLDFEVTLTYADGRQIVVTDTGRNRHGVKFLHENGRDWVFCRTVLDASDRDLLRTPRRAGDIELPVSRSHEGNFLDCVRSGKPTLTPVGVAHRSTTACHLGAICLDLGRPLRWDPAAERFIGDEEANRRLSVA